MLEREIKRVKNGKAILIPESEHMHLPTEARAQLADQLVESLDAAELNRIDRLWSAEARRRLDEIIAGKVETVPGEDALARARRVAAE